MPVISTIAAATARAFGAFKSLGGAADEFFDYVTLLLHGDGTNGAQNNTFLDSSTNNFTITRNGNTTQGTFSPFSQTGWSNYFDTSAYLSVASDLVGSTTSTFTVDGWVYLTATPTSSFEISAFCGLSGQGNGANNYMSFGPTSDSKITLRWFDGATKSAKSTTTLALNTWYYIACVVNSNAISMFINGVSETVTGTTTLTNRAGTATESYIGGKAHTYATLAGYISNVRVSSVARTITAQTAPFTSDANTTILTCKSNRFVDTSSSPKTLTIGGSPSVQAFSPFAPTAAYSAATVGGSGYFDGSGDYLTVSSSSPTDLGTNPFTIECFIYPIGTGQPQFIISNYSNASTGFSLGYRGIDKTFTFNATGDAADITSNSGFATHQWHHIVISGQSGGLAMFVNGVKQGSTFTGSTAFTSSVAARIGDGAGGAGGQPVNGYLASLRVVKGTAVYDPSSSTITVPTAPLTAITNTSLLLNFTNAGILDNTGRNDLETVGNAQISTSVKKFGTGSLAFDGTGDYLKYLGTSTADLGSGNFTIEFWINAPSANDKFILGLRGGMSGSPHVTTGGFGGTTVGALRWASNAGEILSGTTVITDSTWHHCAIVRNGSTITLYVDGVSRGSGTDTTSFVGNGGQITIAENNLGGNTLTGYLDDLRITKGVARYTSNFTPPTKAFEDQ